MSPFKSIGHSNEEFKKVSDGTDPQHQGRVRVQGHQLTDADSVEGEVVDADVNIKNVLQVLTQIL